MPIENRNLEVGTKLIATYKKETYHALVIAGDDRKVRYTLTPYDGREFKSPSSLGTAVTGKSCNGWAFWSVDAGETTETDAPTADVEEPTEEESESEPESACVVEGEEFTESTDRPKFHRVPNQKGVDSGQVRLHCYTCRSSFIVPDDKNPDTCPAGHEPV